MDKLILVRHEKTQANTNRQLSHYNTRITPEWRKRMLQWATYNKWLFDNMVMVSNGQPRCLELFTTIGSQNRLLHEVIDTRFDERDFGPFIEKTKQEAIEILSDKFPDIAYELWDDFSAWMDQELYDEDGSPLFESNKKLQERSYTALMEIMGEFPSQDILIITSTGVLRTLQAKFLWKTTQEFDKYLIQNTGYNKIPNLALTEFQWNKDSLTYYLNYFNSVFEHEKKAL